MAKKNKKDKKSNNNNRKSSAARKINKPKILIPGYEYIEDWS